MTLVSHFTAHLHRLLTSWVPADISECQKTHIRCIACVINWHNLCECSYCIRPREMQERPGSKCSLRVFFLVLTKITVYYWNLWQEVLFLQTQLDNVHWIGTYCMVNECVSVLFPVLDCWLYVLTVVSDTSCQELITVTGQCSWQSSSCSKGTCFNHGNNKLHATLRLELRNRTETITRFS